MNRVWGSPADLFGLLILITASVLLCTQPRIPQGAYLSLMPVIPFVGLYVCLYPFVPPLIRAAFAVTALGTTLHLLYFGRLPQLSVWALFLLALPVVSTMQFYLGYPARVIASKLTVPILQLGGLAVDQTGTALVWNDQMIQYDAPCSGVRMLWAGLFVTFTLAAYYGFGWLRLTASVMIGIIAVLLGNVLRASSLFYIEAEILETPSWWHSGIGLVVFAFTAAAIVYSLQCIRERTEIDEWTERRISKIRQAYFTFHISRFTHQASRVVFIILCSLAALMPAITPEKHTVYDLTQFPGWPKTFNNQPIQPLPLSDREQAFGKGFPGMLGRFTNGEREIVIRWVTQATRKLHPASDCFRGIGYTIEPAPMYIDPDDSHWGSFRARRSDQTLRVYEQIVDADGKCWSDVSAWYWATFLGRSSGPWWAYTVAEKIGAEND